MTENKLAAQWHLAQLRPNCAAIAERNLWRQGFATFLPLERRSRTLGKRLVSVKRPYFAGYLFVGVDAESSPWRAIQSTQGIAQLVHFDGKPASVPSEIVAELRDACDADGCVRIRAEPTKGDSVAIAQGPFTSLIAQIENLTSENRAWILLDVMGQATRVSVRDQDLRIEQKSL